MTGFPIYQRVVAFADTDMAGIVHFSKILCYVEEAEHALLRGLDIEVIGATGGFPKVHVNCDYRKPLKFGDSLEVELDLKSVGERALKWGFVIRVARVVVADGGFVTVWVNGDGSSARIVDEVRNKLTK